MKSKIVLCEIICSIFIMSFMVACRPRQEKPESLSEVVVPVTLCELHDNPARYEGQIVRLHAIIASLEKGPFLFSDENCRQYMPLLEISDFNALNPDLRKVFEISRSRIESVMAMEADVVVTGTFDSQYMREFPLDDIIRYRIILANIEQLSPLRKMRKLGTN